MASNREPLLGAKRQVIQDASQDLGIERHTPPSLEKVCGTDCWLSDERSRAADQHTRSADTKKLSIAVAFCLFFAAVEVAGGVISNSLAILTDAAHLLSDVAGFAISLFSIWAASWEATPRQSYGYFRLEVLGTLLSIQLIWLLTGILVYEAIYRMTHTSEAIDGRLMFIIASFGFCVNFVMVFLLGHHGHGHDYGHGHDHGHEHDHAHGGSQSPGHMRVLVNKKFKHECTPEESMHEHSHDVHAYGHEHSGSQGPGQMHVLLNEELKHDHILEGSMYEHSNSGHEHGQHPHNYVYGDGDLHQHEHHNPMCFGGEREKVDFNGLLLENSVKVDMAVDARSSTKPHEGSINVRGAWLHVFGDLIQSIGVMIGGAVIWVKPTWKVVDLICTLLFSVLVLGTTIKMLREIVEVLMESTPREIDVHELENGLCKVPGVIAIHDLHIWAITLGKTLLACHVTIYFDADADAILQNILGYCEKRFNISHVTVQIERHYGAASS